MKKGVIILVVGLLLLSCSTKDDEPVYVPTPLSLDVPLVFQNLLPDPLLPAVNPLTEEGVALGRRLFFDPVLSADNSQACTDCHRPQAAFSDPRRFSIGITGEAGTRNSMPLQNFAWNFEQKFFWDGRANSLEQQIFEPVTNPIEMNNTWPDAVAALQANSQYPELFDQVFGTSTIDSVMVSKAIAQFLRTLVSGNSKFDKHLLGEEVLSEAESNGLEVFMDEDRGDCFHCHGNPSSPIWSDNKFHNNGLDAIITDRGLGAITGDPREFGLFKSPSLRNLAYSAPFMHDGRFATLDEVIDHYSEGLVYSETIDPLMKKVDQGGVQLTESDKADLKAFLLSLSEPGFTTNPNFQKPN